MQLTKVLAAARKVPENYHNLPQRFSDRHTKFIYKTAPRLPQYTKKIFRYKHEAYHDEWRPWQDQFHKLNRQGVKTRRIFVEPIRHWMFFRGDRVEVIRGPEKGKQGIVEYMVKERNWVFVSGVNLKHEFVGKSIENMGNLNSQEDPLLVNVEVKLVDPSDMMPTDVEWRYDDDGERVRVSKRTERVIPIPKQAYETIDYVDPSIYKDQLKDTDAKEARKVTFTPKPKTFEMDICEHMGIEEKRVPYPMYWY